MLAVQYLVLSINNPLISDKIIHKHGHILSVQFNEIMNYAYLEEVRLRINTINQSCCLNQMNGASYLNLFHATFIPNTISLLPFQLVTELSPKINNEKKANTHTNQQEEARKQNFTRFMHYSLFHSKLISGSFFIFLFIVLGLVQSKEGGRPWLTTATQT